MSTSNEDIVKQIAAMRADVCGHLHKIQEDVSSLKRKYERLVDSDKHLSDHDAKQSSDLAAVIVRLDKIADRDDALVERLDKLTENPTVKKWGGRLFTAVVITALSWLAGHGGKLPPAFEQEQKQEAK